MRAATTATPAEKAAIAGILQISRDARGDHEALAHVRREAALRLDQALRNLASHGVDTDALLDELDPE